MPKHGKPAMEVLDEAECLRLISPGGVGRIAYLGRYDLTVLPVNYRVVNGDILFRTASDSITGEDLRTGLANADFKVARSLARRVREACWPRARPTTSTPRLTRKRPRPRASIPGQATRRSTSSGSGPGASPAAASARPPDPRHPIRPAGPHPHTRGGRHERAAGPSAAAFAQQPVH